MIPMTTTANSPAISGATKMKPPREWIKSGALATCAALILGAVLPALAAPLTPFMPGATDFTLLWWAEGAPEVMGVTNSAPPVLCIESGSLGLVVDTKRLRLLHAGKFFKPLNLTKALERGNAAVLALPPVGLELSVRRQGEKFICVGRGEAGADSFFYPVRFIESGRCFQRVAIEDLEFADATGRRLPATGHLEISFWPDRVVFAFGLDTNAIPTEGELELVAAGRRSSSALGSKQAAVLELFGPANPQRPVVEAGPALRSRWENETGCLVLELPRAKWSNTKGTAYPEEELDRLDRWRFTLGNDTAKELVVPIMFVDAHPPAVTGFTPLLGDAEGRPTGIPVQISKNWHARPDKGFLRHQGPWFHGCAVVRLPAHSRREFTFAMTYARYGGVPGASFAQLSLIGWGHNQFWYEAALGSFGESICYEPGRVQRRCFIDDIRPFMTVWSESNPKPYGWAGNGGGGDFLMWTDPAGKYRGSRLTRTDYRAYGPCLTDVRFEEETAGGEIVSRMGVFLSRSDDYLRVLHHLRYDVRRPVQWQRLAFFQLGADHYNETPARRVALGDAAGLREEWQPARGKEAYHRRGVALTGAQPWISIHDVERAAVGNGGTAASRGLIVRSWNAVLGGKPCPLPYASFYAPDRGQKDFRTFIELSPPPEISALQPGDFVEADVELVIFPGDARAYYGSNATFRAALEADADTWRLVWREAAGNALEVTMRKGTLTRSVPLAVAVGRRQEAELILTGGLGYVPLTFTGLKDYHGYELLVDGRPLNQAVQGNDFWQTDYDPAHQTWSLTYNLLRESPRACRIEFRRAANQP